MLRLVFLKLSALMLLLFPFRFEDPVDQGIPPAVFKPFILSQPAFKLHTESFQHPGGGAIFRYTPRPYPMEVQGRKTKMEHGLGGFGCISSSPVFWGELISKISLVFPRLIHPDPASADQAGFGFEGNRKLEFSPGLFLLLVNKILHKFLRLLRSAPGQGVKALVARVRLIRQYLWSIAGHKFTQMQVFGFCSQMSRVTVWMKRLIERIIQG